MSHSKPPLLPQEIVDIIIDQVALLSDKDRKKTLRSCTTVSRSFYHQSQRQAFSDIAFLVDDYANRRAARLSKALVLNPVLVSNIRSLTFILENSPPAPIRVTSSELAIICHKSKRTLQAIAGRLHLWKNHMTELLELFSQLTLQKLAFTVQGKTALVDWSSFHRRHHFGVDFTKLILQITSNPTLHSLAFNGIVGLPASLLERSAQSNGLWELEPRSAYFERSISSVAEESSRMFRLPTSITSLTMAKQFHPALLPFQLPALPPPVLFPHLTMLVVSLPPHSTEMDLLLQFTLSVAGTLETLELHDLNYYTPNLRHLRGKYNYLGQFPTLRRLNFKANAFQSIIHLHTKLNTISDFLMSTTSPNGLSSISIELRVDLGTTKRQDAIETLLQREAYGFHETGWTVIDESVMNPMFMSLKTVNLNLKMVDDDYFGLPTSYRIKNLQPLLPRTYASPSIKFNSNVEAIFDREIFFMWMF